MLAAAFVAGISLLVGLLVSNFVGGENKIERRIERLYALDDPRFAQELGVLLGPPFLQGTKVRALRNGDEVFPPMLTAIRGAKVSVTFETFIYWSGDIGREFATALAAAFEADLALAHRVSYAEWKARPAHQRLAQWLASLVGTQL